MRLPGIAAFSAKVALLLGLSGLLPPDANSRPDVVAAGQSFACTPTAVWDGDGPL